jgi:uncharacterized protein
MNALPQQVHADAVPPQPWRNGGGRTRELLTRPAGPDWKLRISLADIESDGPFSTFVDTERWFAVVQGTGVTLRFANTTHRLIPGSEPFVFDGAAAPDCTLIAGPTLDLNLMVRGGSGVMRTIAAGEVWNEVLDERGLFVLCDGTLYNAEQRGTSVPARTLVWPIADGPCRFEPHLPENCGWWLGWRANER